MNPFASHEVRVASQSAERNLLSEQVPEIGPDTRVEPANPGLDVCFSTDPILHLFPVTKPFVDDVPGSH